MSGTPARYAAPQAAAEDDGRAPEAWAARRVPARAAARRQVASEPRGEPTVRAGPQPGRRRRRGRCRRDGHPPEHVAALQVHSNVQPERSGRLDPQTRRIFALEPSNRRESRCRVARLVQTVRQPVERFVARLVLRRRPPRPQLRDRARPLLVGNVVLRAPESHGIRSRRRRARLEREGHEQPPYAPLPTCEQHD